MHIIFKIDVSFIRYSLSLKYYIHAYGDTPRAYSGTVWEPAVMQV